MILSITFAISLVVFIYGYTQVSNEMISVFGEDHPASSFMLEISNIYGYLDYALLVSYITFMIGSLVTAWFVRSHPLFFLFFMIGTLCLTFVTYIYKNVFEEFIESYESFKTIYNQLPFTKIMINNLPIFIIVSCCVIALIQYSKIGIPQIMVE